MCENEKSFNPSINSTLFVICQKNYLPAVIKKENTLRERLPVGQFLNCMADMVEKWSHRRDLSSVNCLPFAEKPVVSLKQWTDAFQWAARNSAVLQRDDDVLRTTRYFVTSSKKGEAITSTLR